MDFRYRQTQKPKRATRGHGPGMRRRCFCQSVPAAARVLGTAGEQKSKSSIKTSPVPCGKLRSRMTFTPAAEPKHPGSHPDRSPGSRGSRATLRGGRNGESQRRRPIFAAVCGTVAESGRERDAAWHARRGR